MVLGILLSFAIVVIVAPSPLLSQDSQGVEDLELEGLRPETKPDSNEETGAKDKEEIPESKSSGAGDSGVKEEARDVRTDLEKLIDEQVPDFDPLDVLDSANPFAKVDQLVGEISKNMKEIERLLDQDNTGEANQSMQQQTLSRIDELINEVQRLSGG